MNKLIKLRCEWCSAVMVVFFPSGDENGNYVFTFVEIESAHRFSDNRVVWIDCWVRQILQFTRQFFIQLGWSFYQFAQYRLRPMMCGHEKRKFN